MTIENLIETIGNTPLLKIKSLSKLAGSSIYVKCENFNPGGSIKDRTALYLVNEAIASGKLRPGMTIVEGTAGNTGIGMAVVARSLGYNLHVVMPKGQDPAKVALIKLWGASVEEMDPCPFSNPNHFYHRAQKYGEDQNYWWANQFDNLSNYQAHFQTTGPEIYQELSGKVDYFVSSAGTGGTIAGVSSYLKDQSKGINITLVDPMGSGLYSYGKEGEFKSEGSSFTEGIGIMRLDENMKKANIDQVMQVDDQSLVTMAYHLRDHDGLIPGLSAALNIAAAFKVASESKPGSHVVTIMGDDGTRALSKLYNETFLQEKGMVLGEEVNSILKKLSSPETTNSFFA